jgi:nucleotide-binding universal stress UspA family protein
VLLALLIKGFHGAHAWHRTCATVAAGGLTMDIRDMLFATDFSETAEHAGRYAAELARALGARLHVLHVAPRYGVAAAAAERVDAEGAALARTGVETEGALLTGHAAAGIVRYAREHGIGLIAMGTHGRTGVSRALQGSVAEAVVRRAGCPVITVPMAARAPVVSTIVEPDDAWRATCAVCGESSEDLICGACRDRIRAEALEAKRDAERAGRRGQPA